jgi:exosortase
MPSDAMSAKTSKLILFLLAGAAAVALAFEPLHVLVSTGRPADYYSHIPFILAVSLYILFKRRKVLYRGEPSSLLLGSLVIALGLGSVLLDGFGSPGLISHAQLRAAGSILILIGSYLALFGKEPFRRALFPLLFLLFIIPLPLAWMEIIVQALVKASTGFTHILFRAFGIPFVQDGAVFYLPGFAIKVAQECSGIRSSLALLITSVLAGQIFLNRRWKMITLAVAVFPVTVLKNAVRIVTLYLLSYFVDMRIIQGGFLHRSGGFIFFGLGLVALAYVLWILGSPREAWERTMGRHL